MKNSQRLLYALGILAAFSVTATAQPHVVTVTNWVTVVVTNVVTVTNVVVCTPPSVLAAKPGPGLNAPARYPWKSSVSCGLTLARGNSHMLLYSGDIETSKKTPDNEFALGASGAYGSQDSVDNVNNYKASSQWNHLFTERFYAYARADAMRDVIADLDYRFNVGPGVGYYLIKATNTTLACETGSGYQDEHLGGEYNSLGTLRAAENLEHKFNDFARLWEKTEILPQMDQFQNYLVNAEIGIEASITKSISLKTCLDDNYQSQPAAEHYRNDVKLVSGISYKF